MGELYRSLHYEVTEDAPAEIVRLRRTSVPFEQIGTCARRSKRWCPCFDSTTRASE